MIPADSIATSVPPLRPVSYDKKVGLVLQGGGALGSYQAGVYEALASSSEYLPDWVAGISIGSINAAIIAGNAPEHRVGRLRNFWDDITATTKMWPPVPAGPLAAWQNRASALTTVMFGQPGFFTPRPPQDWFPWRSDGSKGSPTPGLLCTTSPWLAPMPKELGVRVFDVIHEILVGHRKEAA
jgi:Patatin-like phospholipase